VWGVDVMAASSCFGRGGSVESSPPPVNAGRGDVGIGQKSGTVKIRRPPFDVVPGRRPMTHVGDWAALVEAIAAGDQRALHALYERTIESCSR